jgi:hypothetical protein
VLPINLDIELRMRWRRMWVVRILIVLVVVVRFVHGMVSSGDLIPRYHGA